MGHTTFPQMDISVQLAQENVDVSPMYTHLYAEQNQLKNQTYYRKLFTLCLNQTIMISM